MKASSKRKKFKKLHDKKYLLLSIFFHVIVFSLLIFSIENTAPLAVIENTNQKDIISAVVLGDSQKSKVLSQPSQVEPEPVLQVEKPQKKIMKVDEDQKEAIPLKVEKKEKQKKANPELVKKLQQDLFRKNLLADIKKVNDKHKKLKQKQLKAQFQKTLRDQAEKTLREQLLNEEIKLRGTESRQSQGEINKYKALIMQAISEHWIIPPGVSKQASCELLIRLAPGGSVLNVEIMRSSGDPSLDLSAQSAVFKASPLPVPPEPDDFDPFRQFVLKARPENVISNEVG